MALSPSVEGKRRGAAEVSERSDSLACDAERWRGRGLPTSLPLSLMSDSSAWDGAGVGGRQVPPAW